MPTGMHCILVGAFHRLLAGCKCEVWEAWNGPQCNGGTESWTSVGWKSVTGVHGSILFNNCQQCIVYSRAWECSYKLSDQPVCERVTASTCINSRALCVCVCLSYEISETRCHLLSQTWRASLGELC